MTDTRHLYQQVILDHNRHPRHYGALPNASHQAQGHNAACGDQLQIQMIINNDLIKDIRFTGQGCALSKASASIMTELVKGKSIAEVEKIFQFFQNLLTQTEQKPTDSPYQKLHIFTGVKEFPMRIKCATLPWHTLLAAIKNNL
jgi:nitrogen fixation NifU-like protein